MNTLQKIKEIAESMSTYEDDTYEKINEILRLCNQDPEQPKTKIPKPTPLVLKDYGEHQPAEELRVWGDLTEEEKDRLNNIFIVPLVDACQEKYEQVISIATKPKE